MVRTVSLNVDHLVNVFLNSLPFELDNIARIDGSGNDLTVTLKDGTVYEWSTLAWCKSESQSKYRDNESDQN